MTYDHASNRHTEKQQGNGYTFKIADLPKNLLKHPDREFS